MKKNSLYALILVLVMLSSLLTSCNYKNMPIKPDDKRVVMSIGKLDVSYDFYYYVYMNTLKTYENADGNTDKEFIKEQTLETIANTYSVISLANEYKISFDSEDEETIENEIADIKGEQSNKEFEQYLSENYMSSGCLKFVLEIDQLEQKLYSHIIDESTGVLSVDDKTLDEALKKDFVRVFHILISYNELNEQTQKTLAETVCEKAKNGEDFSTLINEYSEDKSVSGTQDGYVFTHGEFDGNEFEKTAFSLKNEEISGVVKTVDGFHIIKRTELDEEYINKNYEVLRKEYKTYLYYEMKENKMNELKEKANYKKLSEEIIK